MDPLVWTLFLLSVCLCTVSSDSSVIPNGPVTQTETANRTTSVSTPSPSTTGGHQTETSTSVPEDDWTATPVVPVTVTSQTTPPSQNESTATPTTSAMDAKSSTSPPTTIPGRHFLTETSTSVPEDKRTTTPGNTRRTEMTSSPPAGTSARGVTMGTTAAARLPTTPGTSSTRPTGPEVSVSPTPTPGNSLTKLAFGVMSFILILIIVMVALVTAIHLRGRCNSTKEEGKKSGDSVVSESQVTSIGEKESITLVSVKTINTETDTDSPQISSVHSTTLDSEEQELRRDLLNTKV
ncbi:endothelial cell-specific chemotaxis regulator isoform X2 [Conger conger]|uniref:endothelial cell-specific chemotaxis regulator isoform X2 n=1 Tax=Conger conger TaxID=82655 RepID=UPI002A5A1B97|nr:endothelial cell-specific chemotaxis regulator isoform X2 [Conger conger]